MIDEAQYGDVQHARDIHVHRIKEVQAQLPWRFPATTIGKGEAISRPDALPDADDDDFPRPHIQGDGEPDQHEPSELGLSRTPVDIAPLAEPAGNGGNSADEIAGD